MLIHLLELLEPRMQRVLGRSAIFAVEVPAIGTHGRADLVHVDQGVEAFEDADDQGAVCPGAAGRDVEGISAGFGWELGAGLLGYEVAERAGGTGEVPIFLIAEALFLSLGLSILKVQLTPMTRVTRLAHYRSGMVSSLRILILVVGLLYATGRY